MDIVDRKISLTETDAIVVTDHDTRVHKVTVRDDASDVVKARAHRDAIQLYRPTRGIRFNAQFAASQLYHTEITECDLRSDGKLQLIFASDGLIRNPWIADNTLQTQGAHFITLAIVDGHISRNLTPEGTLAPVSLYPLSIGGNSDGKLRVVIKTFKDGMVEYDPASKIVQDGTFDHVSDFRFKPSNRPGFVDLYNFDLENFINAADEEQHTADQLRSMALDYGVEEKPVQIAVPINYSNEANIMTDKIFDPLAHFGDAILNPKTGRPLRNYGANNPGNIKDFGTKWVGRVDPRDTARMHDYQVYEVDRLKRGHKDHMVVFESVPAGIRALAVDLKNKQARRKLKSVRAIMNRYAPAGTENPAQEAYIWNISAALNVKPDDTIRVNEWDTMYKFIDAIIREEGGIGNPYPQEWIEEGMIGAGIPFPGEEDPSRPLTESTAIRKGTAGATTIGGAGVIEVVKAVTGTDSTTAEVIVAASEGNVTDAAAVLAQDPAKMEELIALVRDSQAWGTMDYIQFAMIGFGVFCLVDIILDRRLSRLLGLK